MKTCKDCDHWQFIRKVEKGEIGNCKDPDRVQTNLFTFSKEECIITRK